MAKDRISAVIRMMQQDSNRQQKNIKNIDRLDTENDIQDVEIDSSENDITNLKNRIANLEKRLASVKESMIKEKVDLDEMTLAKLKGKIFGKIMSDDKKEKLQQMIKDKGIAAVAKMFGISNRELEAIAESKEGMVKEGVGRIVKGVNTTPDVGINQTSIEAAKLGSKLKNGRPPLLHKTASKNSDPNTLSNLGVAEEKINERGGISVPLSGGGRADVIAHRPLKIKKSTPGRLCYENPKKPKRRKST